MKKTLMFLMSILLIFTLSGCSTILTFKAARDKEGNLKSDYRGIRVYPTRVYLIVKGDVTEIRYLPDYTQAYNIKPIAFLSKNDFSITIKEGQVKSCGATIDTSEGTKAAAEVMKTLEEIKSPKGKLDTTPNPEGSEVTTTDTVHTIAGNLGLKPGIYIVDNTGNITQVISMEEVIPFE